MRRILLLCLPIICVSSAALAASAADLHVWVDSGGGTHVTDAPETIADANGVMILGDPRLNELWDGGSVGDPLEPDVAATSSAVDRQVRALRTAIADIERGETLRAAAALRQVLLDDPMRPEAHFYLGLLEDRRAHWDEAEIHWREFLALAGDRFAPWRHTVHRRLAQLDDERALSKLDAEALELVALPHASFEVEADRALLDAGGAVFSQTVARYLSDVRNLVDRELGRGSADSLGVVLYGRASYARAHAHRFSFQTVGFFDGRVHVVSGAYPAGELRTLLVHEVSHAIFRERTGGDQPYWLNEGLAEWLERRSQGRVALTRTERSQLRMAIETGRWIDLERIAPSFSGLDDDEARLAYTISTAAADWIDRHTQAAERAALLERIGSGMPLDEALRLSLGHGTRSLDAALRAEVLGEFVTPADAASGEPPAAAAGPASHLER